MSKFPYYLPINKKTTLTKKMTILTNDFNKSLLNWN